MITWIELILVPICAILFILILILLFFIRLATMSEEKLNEVFKESWDNDNRR